MNLACLYSYKTLQTHFGFRTQYRFGTDRNTIGKLAFLNLNLTCSSALSGLLKWPEIQITLMWFNWEIQLIVSQYSRTIYRAELIFTYDKPFKVFIVCANCIHQLIISISRSSRVLWARHFEYVNHFIYNSNSMNYIPRYEGEWTKIQFPQP